MLINCNKEKSPEKSFSKAKIY